MTRMGDVIRMPPRGHYSAWEAGQLAGVSGNAIGQWARRGYIRASQSESIPKVYSYQDVAEAMVVHDLLEHGVGHVDIRTAIEALEGYGDWPLTAAPLATVQTKGRSRLVAVEVEATYDVGDRGWQQVVNPENLTRIRSELQRGGWAVRRAPGLKHIEVDPERLSGRPVIRGRRVAAQDVAETAEEPGGREALEEGYGLESEQIDDARSWWREVRQLAA
jgi:uncharacterized protein (DUF433 family)/DNA-binding transcriptional MerR regulator